MADVLNETVEDAMKNVNEACGEALESGKWMFVSWFVKDGKLLMKRTTWNFPTGDFEKCIEQLQNVCNTQTGKSRPDKGPLPFAKELTGKWKSVLGDTVREEHKGVPPMSAIDKVAEASNIPPAKEPTFEEIVKGAGGEPEVVDRNTEACVDAEDFDKATKEAFSDGLEKKVEELDKEIMGEGPEFRTSIPDGVVTDKTGECEGSYSKEDKETKLPCED